MTRDDERKHDEGTASDKDPDTTETGKSDGDHDDQAEADEQAKESFPSSDPPAW